MVRNNRPLNILGRASWFLGQVSLWMGFVLALGWSVLFSLMARHIGTYRAGAGVAMRLPVEPPLVGLVLAILGLLFAELGQQRITGPTLAGLLLNSVALGLALVLLTGCLG